MQEPSDIIWDKIEPLPVRDCSIFNINDHFARHKNHGTTERVCMSKEVRRTHHLVWTVSPRDYTYGAEPAREREDAPAPPRVLRKLTSSRARFASWSGHCILRYSSAEILRPT